jgi:hypothetical protein
MARYIDIKGQRFGLLTVVSREQSKNEKAMWLCQCDCGNTIIARGSSLRDGHTKSCGCIKLNDLDLIEPPTTYDNAEERRDANKYIPK